MFQTPVLTRGRVRLAYATAVATDILQLALGPFGWAFTDEILDVAAFLVISRLLGFHLLLLPTFAIELFPVVDMVPTWTGSVVILVALRKKQRAVEPPGNHTIIDV